MSSNVQIAFSEFWIWCWCTEAPYAQENWWAFGLLLNPPRILMQQEKFSNWSCSNLYVVRYFRPYTIFRSLNNVKILVKQIMIPMIPHFRRVFTTRFPKWSFNPRMYWIISFAFPFKSSVVLKLSSFRYSVYSDRVLKFSMSKANKLLKCSVKFAVPVVFENFVGCVLCKYLKVDAVEWLKVWAATFIILSSYLICLGVSLLSPLKLSLLGNLQYPSRKFYYRI